MARILDAKKGKSYGGKTRVEDLGVLKARSDLGPLDKRAA